MYGFVRDEQNNVTNKDLGYFFLHFTIGITPYVVYRWSVYKKIFVPCGDRTRYTQRSSRSQRLHKLRHQLNVGSLKWLHQALSPPLRLHNTVQCLAVS